MVEIGIMIEGQNGLNWSRWQSIAQVVESLGFAGLYRSDHYTNAEPPDRDSLELWISLTWLASHTSRIEFGPLVSPVSFRDPTMTARMAAGVDDLSGGRLILGMGAGWQEREHYSYGWDLLPTPERFQRFQEGLEVVSRLLHSDQPAEFTGDFYEIHDAILLPRPRRPGGPPILVGGNGHTRTLPLVARYADEWNGVFLTATEYQRLNDRLDELLRQAGRQPEAVRRSLMTNVVFGQNETELRSKLQGRDAEDMRSRGLIVGTGVQLGEQLQALAAAGAQRVMLQWLDMDDLDGLAALAEAVL